MSVVIVTFFFGISENTVFSNAIDSAVVHVTYTQRVFVAQQAAPFKRYARMLEQSKVCNL
jgi:hypothetical protein